MKEFRTVGYGGLWKVGGLIDCLKKNEVTLLVDVRENPWSRCKEFCQGYLRAALTNAGIQYVWRKELGGTTAQMMRHVVSDRLEEMQREVKHTPGNVALMCCERSYEDCHRGRTLTPLLREMGEVVEHLTPEIGKKEKPGPKQITMF